VSTKAEISEELYWRITDNQVCPVCKAALGQQCTGLSPRFRPMHFQRRARYDYIKATLRLVAR
jgi:hypothetical protein